MLYLSGPRNLFITMKAEVLGFAEVEVDQSLLRKDEEDNMLLVLLVF